MMTFRSPNPKHQDTFTHENYIDRGWVNGGVEHCKCSREHGAKEEYDNSSFVMRGTDIITICHTCKSFIHTDMSD